MRAILCAILMALCLPAQAAVYDFVVTSSSGPAPYGTIELDGEWASLCAQWNFGCHGDGDWNDEAYPDPDPRFISASFLWMVVEFRPYGEHPSYGGLWIGENSVGFYNGVLGIETSGLTDGPYFWGIDGAGPCSGATAEEGADWYCRGTGRWVLRSPASVPSPGTLALLLPLLYLTARTVGSARATRPTGRV